MSNIDEIDNLNTNIVAEGLRYAEDSLRSCHDRAKGIHERALVLLALSVLLLMSAFNLSYVADSFASYTIILAECNYLLTALLSLLALRPMPEMVQGYPRLYWLQGGTLRESDEVGDSIRAGLIEDYDDIIKWVEKNSGKRTRLLSYAIYFISAGLVLSLSASIASIFLGA